MCNDNECKTHKAHCRGEEKPAVFDYGTGAIANHVFYVVIETVGTCNQQEMRAMHQFEAIICVKIYSEQQRSRGKTSHPYYLNLPTSLSYLVHLIDFLSFIVFI